MAEEELEVLYWRFDARHKGLGKWFGLPTSERDAFKRTVKQALAEKEDAYQKLMAQAVRFATELSTLSKPNLYSWQQNWKEAEIFLSSPEAQAFLKERGRR